MRIEYNNYNIYKQSCYISKYNNKFNNIIQTVQIFFEKVLFTIEEDMEEIKSNNIKYLFNSYIEEKEKSINNRKQLLNLFEANRDNIEKYLRNEEIKKIDKYINFNLLNLKSIIDYKNNLEKYEYYQLKLDWYSHVVNKVVNFIKQIINAYDINKYVDKVCESEKIINVKFNKTFRLKENMDVEYSFL